MWLRYAQKIKKVQQNLTKGKKKITHKKLTESAQKVHNKCNKNYTQKNRIQYALKV